MNQALRADYPDAVVSRVTVADQVHGTNLRARLLLEYEEGSGPPAAFLKTPGRLVNRMALMALGALNSEASLALSGIELPIEHPRFLAAGFDSYHGSFVLLEDLAGVGGYPNSPRLTIGAEAVADGLTGLARLHARHWERPLSPSGSFVRPWRLGSQWAPLSGASLWLGRRRLAAAGREWPKRATALRLERQFRASASLSATGPLTLLHGDAHIGNSYLLSGDRVGFYDWQLVRRGSWAHDVSYFLISSLSIEDRRHHERELLSGYLAALEHEQVRVPEGREAWDRYRAGAAFGLATWVHTLSAGTFQPREDSLAVIERFSAAYGELATDEVI